MRVRCPDCHGPIEVVSDASLAKIDCPSCGSSFSLIGDDVTETHRQESRRLAQFELLHELGAGRFGSVWLARDTELDRTVAVKIPHKGVLDAAETEKFFRDARAAAQLRHPNIVGVHEVGRNEDTLYIVTDYIKGANLKEWLTGQRLSFRESAELLTKVAEALHHAHESGVVHRDLKPGNIMMDAAGQPYVIDFGLARREAGEKTMTVDGHILGTPAYMSPEQAAGKGHAADRRSDVYALGVILYELLTGELPFRGETRMLLLQIERDEPPRPRKLNARVPRDLETIALKCLEKDPGKRYQTARDLADDLLRYLAGQPIASRPIGIAGRGWRWCKRQPMAASLAAGVALTLLSGTIVSTYFAVREATERSRADTSAVQALAERGRAEAQAAEAKQNAANEAVARAEAEANAKVAAEARASEEAARRDAERRELGARRQLYLANMLLVREAWNRADLARLVELLDREIPEQGAEDPRSFEYYLLRRLSSGGIRRLTGHPGQVKSVAFSPNGRQLVSGGVDGQVRFWEVATGKLLRKIESDEEFLAVALSPDGNTLVTGSGGRERNLKLWDAEKGTVLRELRGHHHNVWALAISPDGTKLYSGSADATVRCWEIASGTEIWSGAHELWRNVPFNGVHNVAISGDGNFLVTTGGPYLGPGEVYVWDAASGKLKKKIVAHEAVIPAVAVSPDGKTFATGSGDRNIKLWDMDTFSEKVTLAGHEGPVRTVSFSPDGKSLVSASEDATVRVWDVGRSALRGTHKPHEGGVGCAYFSPDGSLLASCAVDKLVAIYPVSAPMDFSSHSPSDGAEALHTMSITMSFDFNSDFTLLAAGGASTLDKGRIELWDLPAWKSRGSFKPDGWELSPVWSVALSPDGNTLAAGSGLIPLSSALRLSAGGVSLWDTQQRTCVGRFGAHALAVIFVAYIADGRELLTVGLDGGITRWDAKTYKVISRLRKAGGGYALSAAASPGNKKIAIGVSDLAEVYEVDSGNLVGSFSTAGDPVMSLAFSRDETHLAAGTGNFRDYKTPIPPTVWIWDLRTLEGKSLPRHSSFVRGVAFSPDNKRIASVSFSGEARLFDVESGLELLNLQSHMLFGMSIAFSPDGSKLIVGGDHGQVKIWEGAITLSGQAGGQ